MRNFAKIQRKAEKFMEGVLSSGVQTVITYKMFVSDVYDDSTGMRESTYSEYEVKSIKIDATLHAQIASSVLAGISFGAGQIIYLIRYADMPRKNLYVPEILKDFVADGDWEKQVKVAVPLLHTFVKVQV